MFMWPQVEKYLFLGHLLNLCYYQKKKKKKKKKKIINVRRKIVTFCYIALVTVQEQNIRRLASLEKPH